MTSNTLPTPPMQGSSMNNSRFRSSRHDQASHHLPSVFPSNGTRVACTSSRPSTRYSPNVVAAASARVFFNEAPVKQALGKRRREEEQSNTRVVKQRRAASGTPRPAPYSTVLDERGNDWDWINLLSKAITTPDVMHTLQLNPSQRPIDGFYYLGYTRIANTEPAGGIYSILLRNFDDVYLPSYTITEANNHQFVLGADLFFRLHYKENLRALGGKIEDIFLFIGCEDGEPLVYGVYDVSEEMSEAPVLGDDYYDDAAAIANGRSIAGSAGMGQNANFSYLPPALSPLVRSGVYSGTPGFSENIEAAPGHSSVSPHVSPGSQTSVSGLRASPRVEKPGVKAHEQIIESVPGASSAETFNAASATSNAAIAQGAAKQSSASLDVESSVTESHAPALASAGGSLEISGGSAPEELDADYDRQINELFGGFSSFDDLPVPSSELLDQYGDYNWFEGSMLPKSSGSDQSEAG